MSARPPLFDYNTAFSRNIGWLSPWEQQKIRGAKVAVAGAGGVGGIHLQTLARLGFTKFHVADLDQYELANFNRQAGATVQTIGEEKAHVAARLIRDINPDADITVFDQGVSFENLDRFLEGVDVYIDGLDFFVLDIRKAVFEGIRDRGGVAITAAPIGFGTGYLAFTPDSMSFSDFFDIVGSGGDSINDAAAFLVGLTPAMLQTQYVADRSKVDLAGQRGPSTAVACQLCAGVAAAQAVKWVLGRGDLKPAPYFHHFDAYLGKFVSRKIPGGAKNPVQRVKRQLVTLVAKSMAGAAQPVEPDKRPSDRVMDRVLDAARWAPSADNTQPWQFHVRSVHDVDVTIGCDPTNIYEYRGSEPTVLAAGMLLENMALRAAAFGYGFHWRLSRQDETRLELSCQLVPGAAPRQDTLDAFIEVRQTDRGRLSKTDISPSVLERIAAEASDHLDVTWHTTAGEKRQHAFLNARAATLRYKTAETIPVHQSVVQFASKFPRSGLPAAGLGLNPLTRNVMRWALKSETRMRLLLGGLGGAYLAALEMDVVPGLLCGAHLTVTCRDGVMANKTTEEKLQIGRSLQRIWLACARENIAFQPACAPICFSHYAEVEEPFSASRARLKGAARLSRAFDALYDSKAQHVVFRARLGQPVRQAGQPRSLRRPLEALCAAPSPAQRSKDVDDNLDVTRPETSPPDVHAVPVKASQSS